MKKWLVLTICFIAWCLAGFYLLGLPEQAEGAAANKPVNRIVVTAPNLTEILFSLGLDEQIVGVTMFSKYPPAAAEKPRIGSFWQLNVEAIIAARPDLILSLDFPRQKNVSQRLAMMGYDTLTVNVETVDDLFRSIERVGQAVDRKTEANNLAGDIRNQLNGIQQRVAGRDRPRVMWVIQRDPLRVAGRETFINEMIELAGGVNAIGKTFHQYPPIGTEMVMGCQPDVIIEPSMTETDVEQIQAGARRHWSKYENLPAVERGRVYSVNGDLVSQLGPRLADGVRQIAQRIHPEAFGEDR
ncbi:Vitamin B12-binding protein precursor [Anaerohalosphaera lusitana]|uniref:Vitamin B12-binding protein n=1 Tax=Anaerohalosphaera lusitana TaxID=1936003 RepID=A0A1U9NPQ0_9BACT|nr:helical backbone metal receptor [Anaerohalosphaera lusitana]AQT69724.1 Vitamin B12-binding protein precursor [Anaerohalosphaera lusitana]